jgi:hypothetical protein
MYFHNSPIFDDMFIQISLVCIMLDMSVMNVMVFNHMVHTKLSKFIDVVI